MLILKFKPWQWKPPFNLLCQVFIFIALMSLAYFTWLRLEWQQLIRSRTDQQKLKNNFEKQYFAKRKDLQFNTVMYQVIYKYAGTLQNFVLHYQSNSFVTTFLSLSQEFNLLPISVKPLLVQHSMLYGMRMNVQSVRIVLQGKLSSLIELLKNIHKLPWSIQVQSLDIQQQKDNYNISLLLEVSYL